MAQLDVEKKKDSGSKWWIWLLVAIAAIVILWMVFDDSGDQDLEEPVTNTTAYIDNFSAIQFSKNALAVAPVSEDVYRA